LQHLARGPVERERPECLAVGDLEAHERGAILLLERLHPAAGIEHDGGQRIGLALRGEAKVPSMIALASASVIPRIPVSPSSRLWLDSTIEIPLRRSK